MPTVILFNLEKEKVYFPQNTNMCHIFVTGCQGFALPILLVTTYNVTYKFMFVKSFTYALRIQMW